MPDTIFSHVKFRVVEVKLTFYLKRNYRPESALILVFVTIRALQ